MTQTIGLILCAFGFPCVVACLLHDYLAARTRIRRIIITARREGL